MKHFLLVIRLDNGQYNYQYRIGRDWSTPLDYDMFSLRSRLVKLLRDGHRLRFIDRAALPIGAGKAYEIVDHMYRFAIEMHLDHRPSWLPNTFPEILHSSIDDIIN